MARSLPPLPRKLSRLTDDLAAIPPGYGFQPVHLQELARTPDLLGYCALFEPPLKGHKYLISADVSDGLGQDRSSVDVLRLGTIERVEEQVAHYLSDRIKPRELAFVIDALGHLYCDDDGREALAAIETNNHGLSTQDTLKLHLGYTHFYRWEVADAAVASARFTSREGWFTSQRTRPMLLDHFYEALTTYDPQTGEPDLRVNSRFTLDELNDFQTEGALWEAAAAAGAHDDCIMSLAIGHYVAWRLAGGEREPLADRRRRLRAVEERRKQLDQDQRSGRDYRNMAYTETDIAELQGAQGVELEEQEEGIYDLRGVIFEDF